MNYSKQREVIIEYLKSTTSHPTAAQIYEQAKLTLPNISRGTVYRNLESLVKEGEVLMLDDKMGMHRYDGNKNYHAHFKCVQCGSFEDVFLPELNKIANTIQKNTGNIILSNQIVFDGICASCKTKEKTEG